MGSLIKHLPLEYILNKPKTSNRTKDGLYREYNQWGPENLEKQWFIRFLRHHFPDNQTVVNFFGPVGTPFFIKRQFEGKKVFYTGEDVEHPGTQLALYYGDYCLDHTDLSLGFGQVQHARYLRFPYWIMTTFSPEDDAAAIRERIKQINESHFEKSRECVLINKHDPAGTRELVYNGVKDILDVKLAGQWRNNTRELWDDFGNDKEAYLRTFKFNICAENNNTKDYVTEKIFDAFIADCIPLYYGALNDPEPGLINRDAVIFWNKEGNNEENREKIRELKQNESFYREFMSRPKLLPAAEAYVIDRYAKLKEHFARILGY
ncbi:glycosyltransferase family 10 [uncultured Succiniclasticum sp.]|uniref:glycosyltransferase family 10 domain-containing protein n=1 Tax=uncultured Succiniclasticum sp. TaxID=1500547 RepID=UPI0025D12D72|nr:glycosyltransferase family 10 [uncultured Succiniclasticum sp.]